MAKEKHVAVVTGAAQGIGRRVAEILADRGYRVVLNDLLVADGTRHAIESRGGEAIDFPGDITDESVVDDFVHKVYDTWGQADVLINNAGISLITPAENVSGEDYRRVLEVNLVAPFLLAKALVQGCSLPGEVALSM